MANFIWQKFSTNKNIDNIEKGQWCFATGLYEPD